MCTSDCFLPNIEKYISFLSLKKKTKQTKQTSAYISFLFKSQKICYFQNATN